MSQELLYGKGQSLRLQVAEDALVAHCAPDGETLGNPREAVCEALLAPVGFPPITNAVVPEDKVAIAIDRLVPRAADIVAGIVDVLRQTGRVATTDITVVHDGELEADELLSGLDDDIAQAVHVERHDPANRERLSYLAASREGEPIYMNRTLVDADLVVPVGAMRPASVVGYWGLEAAVFPAFSDSETLKRFRSPQTVVDSELRESRRKETSEAAQLLGTLFTLQVIPGPGDSVLEVVAGDSLSLAREAQPLCERAWNHPIPRRADLVVASIEGGRVHQTWENLGRALFNACNAVEDNGAVVLCTRLAEAPGDSLKRLANSVSTDELLEQLENDDGPDAVLASLIASQLERVRLYLLSDLDSDFVEELGIGPIADKSEVARLVKQSGSCLLLPNAHLATTHWKDN